MPRSGCKMSLNNMLFLALMVTLLCSALRGGAADLGRALVSLSGAHSGVGEPLILRVTDEAAWAELWERHAGEAREKDGLAVKPEIDFSRCMVLCVFEGLSKNSSGERLESIEDRGEDLLVRYENRQFQTVSGFGETTGGVDVTPYGLFVVDLSAKPVVFEKNVQGLIGGAPIWKEQVRLPGLPGR